MNLLLNELISDIYESIDAKIDWSIFTIEENPKHLSNDAITLGLIDIIAKPESLFDVDQELLLNLVKSS